MEFFCIVNKTRVISVMDMRYQLKQYRQKVISVQEQVQTTFIWKPLPCAFCHYPFTRGGTFPSLIPSKWSKRKAVHYSQLNMLRKLWEVVDAKRIGDIFATYTVQERAYCEFENDRIMKDNVDRKRRRKPVLEYLAVTSDEEVMKNIDQVEPSIIDGVLLKDLRKRKKLFNGYQKFKDYQEQCRIYEKKVKERISFTGKLINHKEPKEPFFRALLSHDEMLHLISIGIEETRDLQLSLCFSPMASKVTSPSFRPFFLKPQNGAMKMQDGKVIRANGRALANSLSASVLMSNVTGAPGVSARKSFRKQVLV
jgi:hypothetical protein